MSGGNEYDFTDKFTINSTDRLNEGHYITDLCPKDQ